MGMKAFPQDATKKSVFYIQLENKNRREYIQNKMQVWVYVCLLYNQQGQDFVLFYFFQNEWILLLKCTWLLRFWNGKYE